MNAGSPGYFSGNEPARVPSTAIGRPVIPQFVRTAPNATRPDPQTSAWRAGGI